MTNRPKLVIIESPFAGDVHRNIEYARLALKDALDRGEAPFASHLLYTQPGVLNDLVPAERKLGIEAGLAWGQAADLTAVYFDLGISEGMRQGIARAQAEGRPVEYRSIGPAVTDHAGQAHRLALEALIDAESRSQKLRGELLSARADVALLLSAIEDVTLNMPDPDTMRQVDAIRVAAVAHRKRLIAGEVTA